MRGLDYDGVFKELFEQDRPAVLGHLTGGVEISRVLKTEFPRTIRRTVDFLFLGSDDRIYHLEFQAYNFGKIAYRQGICCFLIGQSHPGHEIRQIVLYVGSRKMTMPDGVDFGGASCSYRIVDFRNIDADVLLGSGHPGDLALAVLARGGGDRLPEILGRAKRLPAEVRERVTAQIVVLSGLRKLSWRVKSEMKSMGLAIDIEKNALLSEWHREARDKGRAEGRVEGRVAGMAALVAKQLSEKFGGLPKWARQRVDAAKPNQLDLWASRLLSADTLEDVIGRR